MSKNTYACIEIGGFEVKMVVSSLREERFYVLSKKEVEAAGIERGQVTNLDKLVAQIKKLKQLVEEDLKRPIHNVLLSLPAIDVMFDNVIARVNLDLKNPITAKDIRELFRIAMEQEHEPTHFGVNLIPRLFRIDESHIVQHPKGLTGRSLGLEARRVLAPTTGLSNLVHAIESAGLELEDVIMGNVAESLFALTTPEAYMKSCQINIGHSVTTVTVIHEGSIIHSHALSIGGKDVTEEIMRAFSVEEAVAEGLKTSFGRISLLEDEADKDQVLYQFELKGAMKVITQGMLDEVVTKACQRLLKLIRNHIIDSIRLKEQEYQYALSGGTSELKGLVTVFEALLKAPTTLNRPSMLGVRHAKYSTLVATSIFAHELFLLTGDEEEAKKETEYPSFVRDERDRNRQELTELKPPVRVFDDVSEVTQPVASENMKVFGADDIPLFGDGLDIEQDSIASEGTSAYMDEKLEKSGVVVKIFEKIFNEQGGAEADGS